MARSMLSLGMFAALALRMAVRRRGLVSWSPPPILAAMLISLISLVNIWPRLASARPFLCLMVCHLLWPDMLVLPYFRTSRQKGSDHATPCLGGCQESGPSIWPVHGDHRRPVSVQRPGQL